MKRFLKWALVAVAALAVAAGGYYYYQRGQRYPSTNDAYIKANIVKVASEVGGRVVSVPVSSHEPVKQGQLLFTIDPAPYRQHFRKATSNLALTRQNVSADEAAVSEAKAAVTDAAAHLDDVQRQFKRTKKLARRDVTSQSQLDDARAELKRARASLALAKARLEKARRQLGDAGERNERVQKARTAVKLAALDLEHTTVEAPCAGTLAAVDLLQGDMISAGQSRFPLVCSNRFWVYANFKETDLARIRPGQIARIAIDMYPDHTFHGVVESIDPASGAAFSLLPPENATGNWVKVTQRVPVRILIVDRTARYPLRVQTSSTVTIDTGAGDQPLGTPRGVHLSTDEAKRIARRHDLLPTAEQ